LQNCYSVTSSVFECGAECLQYSLARLWANIVIHLGISQLISGTLLSYFLKKHVKTWINTYYI
jgi:hypothetical protein